MKTVKIVFISALVLFGVLLAGGYIFLRNLDINRYIPQAAEAVAKATGRQLTVGNAALAFSWDKGVVLVLREVSLSDDNKFSDQPFLTIPKARLAFDIRAAFVDRMIMISDVTVIAPGIRIIRGKNGDINAASIGGSSSTDKAAGQLSGNVTALALPVLLVRKIEVRGAVIHYIDQSFEPAIALDISKVDIDMKGFSLTDPCDVLLSAALFSESTDTRISGRMGLDILKSAVRFESVKADIIVDGISAEKLARSLPMIKPLGFKKAGGMIQVQLKEAVIGAKGLEILDAQAMVRIKDILLEGGNIFALGIKSIPLFPDLMDKIFPELALETQEDIRRGITVINGLDAVIRANRDVMTIEKATLSTREISAEMSGEIPMAGRLDINARILTAEKLSGLAVHKVPDLAGLRNKDGQIDIPVFITGSMAAPEIRPDIEYLTKKLFVQRGGQELQKAFKDPAVSEAVGKLFGTIFRNK